MFVTESVVICSTPMNRAPTSVISSDFSESSQSCKIQKEDIVCVNAVPGEYAAESETQYQNGHTSGSIRTIVSISARTDTLWLQGTKHRSK